MNFKKRVALLLSFCITVNIATQTAGAISSNPKQVDEKNNTNNIDILNSVDDKEWFLDDTDEIYHDFKDYIHTVLDISKNQIILLSDIINYTGDLDIPSHIKGLPSIINKFINVQNIKIDSTTLISKYITQELFQEDMQNLKTFSISSNGNKSDIYKLNSNFLQNAPLLEELSIEDTNISSIPSSVLNNPNLLSVNISNNNIKSLPKNIFTLNNKIKNLDISNNNIIELNQDFFNENTSLEKIDISGNNIISLNNNYLKLSNKNIIRIEYDNFFTPINDSYPQNRDNYKIISPENISSLNMIKGKEISNELLHSILGKFSVINNKTNIRSTLNSDIPLEFIPTSMSKNYFTKNNIPNKVGEVTGFIKVVNSNNNKLKTNILKTNILESNFSSSLLQNIILKEDVSFSTNFDPNIYSYNLVIPNGMETVDINAISENDNATLSGDIGTISVENGKEISINVTSSDKSSSSNYKIKFIQNKSLSSDSTLKSIEIDGLLSDFNFDKNIFEYNINIDNNTDSIKINPILSDDSATLNFNGINKDIILNNGKNVFTIIVDSPDRSNKSIYVLNLNKSENNIDNDGSLLESLSIDNYEFMPLFQKDILNYTLEVSPDVSSLKLDASTIAGSSITFPNGKKNLSLKSGLNTFEIKVNSSFGVSRTYTLNILRKSASSNADLSSLKIVDQDGKRISFDRTFNRNTTEYKINKTFSDKDFSADNFIKIEATSSNSKATVYGAETFVSMDSGENIILPITVLAEDGITNKTYNINLSKKGNSIEYNNDIENIIPFSDKTLIWDKPFSKDITEYNIVAPFEQTSIGFYIDTYMKSTTIESNFENNIKDLSIGNNRISFITTSSDGSVKTYNLNIIRQSKLNTLNSNNNLMDIKINGISIPDFNPDKKSYTMYMKDSIDQVDISAFSLDPSSKIKTNNLGNQKINDGENRFNIPITGKDGKENLYSIIINRTTPPSEDLSLTDLQVKDSSTGNLLNITPVFDTNIGGYTLTVPNAIDSIDIESTAFDITATISGDGTHKLITGENAPLLITVKLPDNSEYSYSLIVTREKSDVSTLQSLNVSNNSIEIPLDQPFDPIIESYSVTFPYEIDNIDINAITTDSGASITSGLGNIIMDVGLKKVAIVVLSEDGTSTTSYNLDITRKASTDSTLSNLQVYLDDRAIEIDGFDPTKTDYEIEVIDFISSGYLIPTVNNEFATFKGDLTSVDLITGDNKLSITVTAQDGISITVYNLNIIKKKSNVSTLSNIEIALDGIDTNMVPSFSSDVLSYNIGSTDASVISINATKTNEKSTVTGDGDIDLILGINNIPILVTAEDGTTTTYYIIIENVISSNAKLKSLAIIIDGINIPIEPTFNPERFDYKTLNAVYSDSAEIVVVTENNKSTIIGDGKISLNDLGDNRNLITVTAEDGSTQNYSINIIKGASDNANLKTLSVTDITGDLPLDPVFNKDTLEYTLEVENNIDKINILATAEDSKAKILGIGNNKDLAVGVNAFDIDITAEDGSTKKYKISITRKGSTLLTDIFLEALDGKEIPLSPRFNPSTKSYTASVENDIDEISILASSDSGTDITGDAGKNKKLDFGLNTVSIIAQNKAGESSEYIIEVTRKAVHLPAILDSLIVNVNGVSQPLTPIFDSSIKEYTLNLPREISKATIYGTNADSRFSISGAGEISLNHGENIVTVTVSDTIDPSNTADYIIKINREKANNNANLSSLSFNGYLGLISEGVKDLAYTPTVSPGVSEYQVTISEPKDFTITEILEDSKATITHNRPALLSGRFNIWETIITAEDGVTTKTIYYKIYLQENIASIFDFSPVDDITFKEITLSPAYDDDIKDYTSTVLNETTGIEITLKYYDANKTIVITGNENLKVGLNVITIDITAENPNTRNIYTINVTREAEVPAFLETLSITDKDGVSLPLSPVFDSSIKEYTLEVPNSISEVDINATIDSRFSISGTGKKSLSVGENTVTVTVTNNKNSSNTADYIVRITRKDASNNTNLADLKFNGYLGPISEGIKDLSYTPSFGADIKQYNITVGMPEDFTITETLEDSSATITHNRPRLVSGQTTTWETTITAKDGVTTKTILYKIYLQENHGYLRNIIISDDVVGTDINFYPIYSHPVKQYSAKVKYSTTGIDFYISPFDNKKTIVITGNKNLKVGLNVITLDVTAENKNDRNIYTVNLTREPYTGPAFLETLSITDKDGVSHPLSPLFNSSIKEYTLEVPYTVSEININATTDSKFSILGGNNDLINLSVGNSLAIVTATDKTNSSNTAEYIVRITRKDASNNANLAGLSFKGYLGPISEGIKDLSYTPSFGADITEYNITVGMPEDFVINETLQDPKASIVHKRPPLVAGQTTTWETTITAEDGVTTKTILYKIYLQQNIGFMNDFILSDSITGKYITFSPSYDIFVKEYFSTVEYSTTDVDFYISPLDNKKNIVITGNKNLKVGLNVVTVDITAENQNVRNIYTINITREAAEVPAFLETLSITDKDGVSLPLSPVFD
ncbi:MAG: cadherin-like beta sandwich domain-containing protein, partial [Oscillospiraceae bacterium]|nr:cadherin-like beta sandwich domain-containing protein [Oscillospiraceae bacterium]